MKLRKLLLISAVAACVCLVASGHAAEAESSATESGAKSADEIAKELANPNNSLASLTFKNQFRWYTGDLPGADNESNYTLLFQPTFPFSLGETATGGKANFFARPAIPFLFDQPVPSTNASGQFDFDDVSAMGDIGFDLAYGVTEKSGLLWALGAVGTLPTATDERLGSGKFSLGPNVFLAQFNKWGLYGVLANQQWDVAGWGDNQVSVSSVQPLFMYLPGGGWNVGTTGILTYNWDASQWTIPLNLTVGRTVMMGKTPVKIQLELNYYVEKPDAFGPEWMIGLNITPVVPNVIETWVKGL